MITKEQTISFEGQNYTILLHSGGCGCFTLKLKEQVLGNGKFDGKNITEYSTDLPLHLYDQILTELRK